MNDFIGSIDTDMAIGTILSNFETPWIMHTVQDSLNMKFRPFREPMPNFADIVNRQFNTLLEASPDYRDKVEETRRQTLVEIIDALCTYYNLIFVEQYDNINTVELYGIAHTMYDILVSRFTDYMVNFFTSYIMNNIDSIYAYLVADDNVRKMKEKDSMARSYIDPKFMLIHANLNRVIDNMRAYDIPLETLLEYFTDQSTAARLSMLLEDTRDIYKFHYAIYLEDDRYRSQLLTAIKLRLQARTQESFSVNNTI